MKTVILLTATITPNSWAGVITNPDDRRQQYMKALNWYLNNTDYDIVFTENSGEKLQNFIDSKFLSRVEFLSYIDLPENPDRSKGYKEMKIIEYAYHNSQFVTNADVIVKITGRLICLNVVKIVDRLAKKKLVDFISCIINFKQTYTNSRLFIFSKSFLPVLINTKSLINSSFGFEDALLVAVNKRNQTHNIQFCYLPYPPKISGIGGGFGYVHKTDFLSFAKIRIKHCLKKWNYCLRNAK